MNKKLKELTKLCAESLKDRLLNQFTYEDRQCDECCNTCDDWHSLEERTEGVECGECVNTFKYNPTKGVFVCNNGHEVKPKDFYIQDRDIYTFIDAIFWNLDEFHENRTVLDTEEINLPVLMDNLRFDSSKHLLEERLKSE